MKATQRDGADESFPQLRQDARQMVESAFVNHVPGKVFVLFSGGGDSSVLAHWAKQTFRDELDAAVYIDTGTALPGVREFVEMFCRTFDIPLKVYEAGPEAYRALVLEQGGLPGPAGHGRAYTRLKERQIEALVRDHKTHRCDRIMLLTGKRRSESKRRGRTTAGVERRGAQLYVNPLIDWTSDDMRSYRASHGLPVSEVGALIHRSGECNCGAFAAGGEREMLRSLWPDWFERTIASLEREAEQRGVTACRWGERPPEVRESPGPLCSDCTLWQEQHEEAAA